MEVLGGAGARVLDVSLGWAACHASCTPPATSPLLQSWSSTHSLWTSRRSAWPSSCCWRSEASGRGRSCRAASRRRAGPSARGPGGNTWRWFIAWSVLESPLTCYRH